MNYFDDELEKGKDGRDGRNQTSPGPAASQNPRPVRRPAARERVPQPQEGARRQAMGMTERKGPETSGISREASGNWAASQMGNRNSQPQRTVRSQAAGDYSQPGPSSRRQPGSGSSSQSGQGSRVQSGNGSYSQESRVQSGNGSSSQPGQGSRRQPAQGGMSQPGRDGREPQRVSRARTSANGQSPRLSGGPKLNGNGQDEFGHRDGNGSRITATSQAAKKQAQKTEKNRKKRRLITLAIAECIALIFIFTYAFFARKWSLIVQSTDWNEKDVTNPVFSVEVPEYMKGHWTFAVFGVDSRDKNVLKGTNSDVIMICDVNQDTGEIKLVSVFRDTYLNLDDKGTYNKINQAYFVGGPTQAVKALNKNLDLNITDYVTFNWSAVANGINVLGGIDMNISKAEFYYINSFITETVKGTGIGSHQLTHAGENHLDGVQAVAYGRLRLMDTDYARTERQRKVVEAAFKKAIKADLKTLNSLVGAVLPQVSTCIDVNDIFGMIKNVTKYHIGDTMGFPAARGEASIPKKGACVIPQTLESNVVALHQFLYGEENYVPSKAVKEISAKIASDTGMYKAGTAVNHVSTDNGVIPSSKAPAKTTEESDEKESSKPTFETDEEGNFYDEEGNLVDEEGRRIDEYGFLIDEEGRRIDEEGNLLEEPGETDVSGNPIVDGELVDENGRPLATVSPGETTASGRPTRPGETTASGRPTRPEESTSPSRPSAPYPGESTAPSRPVSPGVIETTEGVGPGTGMEPGGNGNQGGGMIDNSTNGPSSGGSIPPGGTSGPGQMPDSSNPGPSGSGNSSPGPEPGGNSTVTPAPTMNYDNVGPGI